MPISTPLTVRLGIRHPILSAPMDVIAGARLIAAVSAAGGFGILGGGYGDRAWLEQETAKLADVAEPFGVGFITWSLAKQPQLLDQALERQPAAVMLSFGDPEPYVTQIRDAGAKTICQVQTLGEAEQAVRLGVDVIIAQGRDAGGHSGTTRGTMGFVPAVVDIAGSIPVVAAGGIADGRGLAAVLSLGGSGVSMGTRFTATRESLWDDAMKSRVVASGGDQTAQTRVFDIVRGAPWPAQYPGRALRNDFYQRWHGNEEQLQAQQADAEKSYLATKPDDFSARVIWAGEGVDLVKDLPSAAELIERIIDEAASVLTRATALVR